MRLERNGFNKSKKVFQYLLRSPNWHQPFNLTWYTNVSWLFVWHCLWRNGQVYIIVPRWTSFTKTTPHFHLYMIHQCHVVVCVLGLYFTFEWPWLGRNCLDYISVPASADPGIFVGGRGGGSNLPKNFYKKKKEEGGGFSIYSAIVRSKSIFAMETALQTSYYFF